MWARMGRNLCVSLERREEKGQSNRGDTRGALGKGGVGRALFKSWVGWVWADLSLSGLSLSQHLGKLQKLMGINCGPGAREKVCAHVCVYRERKVDC